MRPQGPASKAARMVAVALVAGYYVVGQIVVLFGIPPPSYLARISPMSIPIPRPAADEFAPYYGRYIQSVPEGGVLNTLESNLADTLQLLRATPDERGTFRYQPGKWSVNDVIGHITDAERVSTYRALRFARGDRTPLEGFDENEYAAAAGADGRSIEEMAQELEHVRRATIAFFRSLDPEAFSRRGIANGHEVSVRALAYIIAGHSLHHVNILRERYKLGS